MRSSDFVNIFLLAIYISEPLSLAAHRYYTNNGELIDIGEVEGIFFGQPSSPDKLNSSYLVYDKDSRDRPRHEFMWNASMNDTNVFQKEDKIKVIIHGYAQNYTESWIHELKNAFLDRGDENTKVIVVNWANGAADGASITDFMEYYHACNNLLMEARMLAAFVKRLTLPTNEIPEKSIHIVGHSLGGQMMGQTVRRLAEGFQIKVGRATALDVADPIIGWAGYRPDKRHAHFMEAMHTSSAISRVAVVLGSVGIYQDFAHVDLYPNRGIIIQPGCRGREDFLCSHNQACDFYTELIKRCDGNHDFDGQVCRSRFGATILPRLCLKEHVKICELLEKEANRSTHDPNSRITYFETNGQHLKIDSTK